jgi:4-amino-4-deoxychorismate lyase
MYGESVFTTMRMIDGVMKDWNLHFERMRRGVEFIYGPFTDGDEWIARLKNRMEGAFQDLSGDKVVRLTVYREQARGLIRTGLISVQDLKIHVNHSVFDSSRLDEKPLRLRSCGISKKPHWWPSYLKAGNYLETILAQKMYLKPGDDDLLFLAQNDTVLESSVANIFIVRHNKLYTAPVGPNVLEGVMRKKVCDVALEYFNDFEETETTMVQLLKADAVFGSNSVRGLFLVDRIDDYEITYKEDFIHKFEKLKDRVTQ